MHWSVCEEHSKSQKKLPQYKLVFIFLTFQMLPHKPTSAFKKMKIICSTNWDQGLSKTTNYKKIHQPIQEIHIQQIGEFFKNEKNDSLIFNV